ncbi:septum site-determining protein Ssd [Streptomyces sp. NRRL F-5755]|uniref:septum site-determining protein Ssd n=1 Tax=Streptomyces sp. NRRL F-5755 TaxID=1519475 RepID=UPI003B636FF5
MAGCMTSDQPQGTAEHPGGPLIVTEDDTLLDDLLRLCAAAGTTPEVARGGTARSRGRGWASAPLVIVGDDCAPRLCGAARRDGVVLVARGADERPLWQLAVALGAERVLVLPGGESWLVDRIADAAEGAGPAAVTVGVIGGSGGAGASTLACALAVAAARAHRRTILIDADPLGGGLDVLLGGEKEEGLRWPAFAESRGRVAGGALEESLPRLHSLRVLSWDRGDAVVIPPQAMRAVVAAARRRGGAVVIDLPRRLDDAVAEALAQVDVGLLVVPAELRAVAAARRVAAGVRAVLPDLRVVTRDGPGTDAGRAPELSPEEVARLLGLPLAGELGWEPGLSADLRRGAPPGSNARGPLRHFGEALWERVVPRRQADGETERSAARPERWSGCGAGAGGVSS